MYNTRCNVSVCAQLYGGKCRTECGSPGSEQSIVSLCTVGVCCLQEVLILLKMFVRRVFMVFSLTYLCVCQVRPQFVQNSLCRQLYRGTCRTICLGSERHFPVPDSVLFCRGGSCCKSDTSGGIWAAWTAWSTCAASCGDGVRTRSRTCQFGQCLGESTQTGLCRRPGCLLLPPTSSTIPTSTTATPTPSTATSTNAGSVTTPTTLPTAPVTSPTSPDTSETTVPSTSPTTPPTSPTTTTTTTTVPVARRRCGSVNDPGSVPGADCFGSSWSVSLEIVNVDGDVSTTLPVCSGVLLSMTEILATAECAEGLKRTLDVPRLQSLAVAGSVTCGTQTRTITNVTLFDKTADLSDMKGDLAILSLVDGFKSDDCASSACLPNTNDVFNRGDRCRLTGWGKGSVTEAPSAISVSQQQTSVTFLPFQACQTIYDSLDPSRTIYNDSVCTDSENDNFAPCQDANGWMLVCDNSDGSATLVGLATPDSDCVTTRPSVYQGVQMHLDWIETRIQGL
ncbi:serine protease Hayan-like [Haliotis asinina]|uniref:serine protease Hayan-like n=1 Tax=Haliotis asinina TaxID=109174 RepID=UPI0035325E0B